MAYKRDDGLAAWVWPEHAPMPPRLATRGTQIRDLQAGGDGIAPSRATADAHHQQSVVAQLLALLDGLESRNGVFVLATTNRPKSIDPALTAPAARVRLA